MKIPVWSDRVAEFFQQDGALRDIYVPDVTPAIWAELCSHIVHTGTDVSFSVDGEPAMPPDSWTEAFRIRDSASPVLLARVGSPHIAIHFFCDSEFECDFWPSDIQCETQFHDLCRFIESLGSIAGRDVLLTDENYRDSPFMIYSPSQNSFNFPK